MKLRRTHIGIGSRLLATALLPLVTFAVACLLGSAPSYAQKAYITSQDGGVFSEPVSVIDTATNAVTATIPGVGVGASGVAVTSDGSKVYVTNFYSGTVSVIDAATNAVTATITVGGLGFGMAVSPDGSKVYAVNYGNGSVSVIDTATNAVTATINVGAYPIGAAVSPDGSKVYVTSYSLSSVLVIDTATNALTATIAVGAFPYGVAVSPDGSKVYVANLSSNNVSVVDTATNMVTATITVGALPFGVAVTPDGSRAYVTNSNSSGSVSVIDTATNAVTATIAVGSYPDGVAVTADGSKVYVANYGSNSVSVIDAATNVVSATITDPSFVGPLAFGVFIAQPPVSHNTCPLPQGFWKTNAGLWPVTSLALGGRTYSEAQLIGFLNTPPTGNAASILADQLIATKLSVANGSDPAPISSTVAAADSELATVPALPTVIRTNTAAGQAMVTTGATLNSYNNDQLTPNCTPFVAP